MWFFNDRGKNTERLNDMLIKYQQNMLPHFNFCLEYSAPSIYRQLLFWADFDIRVAI